MGTVHWCYGIPDILDNDQYVLDENLFVFGSFTEQQTRTLLDRGLNNIRDNDEQQGGSSVLEEQEGYGKDDCEQRIDQEEEDQFHDQDDDQVGDNHDQHQEEEEEEEEVIDFQAVQVAIACKSMVRELIGCVHRCLEQERGRNQGSENDDMFSEHRGMVNLGNTCFINAVVQSLVGNLGPLWESVCDWYEKLKDKEEFKTVLERIPMLLALARLSIEMTGSQTTVFKFLGDNIDIRPDNSIQPDRFVYCVRDYFQTQGLTNCVNVNQATSMFSVAVHAPQQDAHEFLEWFVDSLHEEQVSLLKLCSGVKLPDQFDEDLAEEENEEENGNGQEEATNDDNDGWEEVVTGKRKKTKVSTTRVGWLDENETYGNTFITNLFQGVLRSSIRTAGVKKESVTLQPFRCLQLDVLNSSVRNVRDAMELYMAPEMLEGLKMDGNDDFVHRGQKSITFEHLPPVLILHLKRFVYSQDTGKPHKIRKLVSYTADLEIPDAFLSKSLKTSLLNNAAKKNRVPSPSSESMPRSKQLRTPKELRAYKLNAVVSHLGPAAIAGHYISWTLDSKGQWWEQNDQYVTTVKPKQVLNCPDAYLLIYHRKFIYL